MKKESVINWKELNMVLSMLFSLVVFVLFGSYAVVWLCIWLLHQLFEWNGLFVFDGEVPFYQKHIFYACLLILVVKIIWKGVK